MVECPIRNPCWSADESMCVLPVVSMRASITFEIARLADLHVFLRCSSVVLVISSFICCRAGEVGSLDLRSSRALILSNISAGTGSVLIRCLPEDICCDAAFRIMVCKIFSPFWQFVFCSTCHLSPYDMGPSLPSLN